MYESSYREPPPYERAYHLSYQSSYILVLVPLFAYEKSFGRYENIRKSVSYHGLVSSGLQCTRRRRHNLQFVQITDRSVHFRPNCQRWSLTFNSMLQEQFWPEVKRLGIKEKAIYMQDGAPPYWSRAVRDWLYRKFQGIRWIGREEPVHWPPCSPDLTHCDFFLWGFIKSKSYGTCPRRLQTSMVIGQWWTTRRKA